MTYPANIQLQLERFKTGFPYLKIEGAATVGRGILKLEPQEEEKAVERWHQFLSHDGEVVKFVPASGAASRMFKALFTYANGDTDSLEASTDVKQIVENIAKMPFYHDLETATQKLYNLTVEQIISQGRNRDLIHAIISPEGLNYGQLPKGLLQFHNYPSGPRIPLEEHLTEGAQTAANGKGEVKLHFTVSANHRKLFEDKLKEAIPAAEARTGKKFTVELSEQKPETDTVAVNSDNTPFIKDGKILMRPGGHGALIENLNDINAAVVFIKNIDNVVPDSKRESTIRYKQVLGGVLLQVHDKIEEFLISLQENLYTPESLDKMLAYIREVLCTTVPDLADEDKADWIKKKLNRPIRVCGMVKNEGEPGGGPYLASTADGTFSPQILESNQIDPNNQHYKKMMAQATHFNPVDLVCYIRDIHGKPFNLTDFVDPSTGFISSKTSEGRELKALELPGLWNGAMSDWNTVFVEVPISTFNPVKTVNDLLRDAHQ